jgi:hypothetical protein
MIPSKLIFGNSPLSPPLGILIGQTQTEKEVDWILMIPYLDRIGVGIQEHTTGFLAIPNNRPIAKVISAREFVRQSDEQQQQQQQKSLFGFR